MRLLTRCCLPSPPQARRSASQQPYRAQPPQLPFAAQPQQQQRYQAPGYGAAPAQAYRGGAGEAAAIAMGGYARAAPAGELLSPTVPRPTRYAPYGGAPLPPAADPLSYSGESSGTAGVGPHDGRLPGERRLTTSSTRRAVEAAVAAAAAGTLPDSVAGPAPGGSVAGAARAASAGAAFSPPQRAAAAAASPSSYSDASLGRRKSLTRRKSEAWRDARAAGARGDAGSVVSGVSSGGPRMSQVSTAAGLGQQGQGRPTSLHLQQGASAAAAPAPQTPVMPSPVAGLGPGASPPSASRSR